VSEQVESSRAVSAAEWTGNKTAVVFKSKIAILRVVQHGKRTQTIILTGPTTALPTSLYSGFSTLPNFGPGGFAAASSGSGDLVGVIFSTLTVPQGYVSGNALSDSSTYDNATFFSLGVTPGTYEWTWGTGANQNFTLQIGPAGVPDAGSTIGLLFLSLIGLFGLNRLRHVQLA